MMYGASPSERGSEALLDEKGRKTLSADQPLSVHLQPKRCKKHQARLSANSLFSWMVKVMVEKDVDVIGKKQRSFISSSMVFA